MANAIVASDNEVPRPAEPEIDAKIYNSIAKCAKLLTVQLIESNFTISPKFFETQDEGNFKVDFSDEYGSYDQESRVSTCIFVYESYKKVGRSKLFDVKCKFLAFYQIPVECDDLHALAFSRKTGLIACYPYFRAYVAHTASLANAEIPILPTIASLPVKEKVRKEGS